MNLPKKLKLPKFNVGDIVKISNNPSEETWWAKKHVGDIAIVMVSELNHYTVYWKERGLNAWFNDKDLELVKKFDWSDYE